MKKIGITCGFLYPDNNRKTYNAKTLSFVENETMEYIAKPGIFPIVVPNLKKEILLPFLDQMDAFVLHGGSDVAPQSYGESPIGEWLGDKYRDEYELNIIDYAFQTGKPLLGICRGCQILNVYFGGTLFQDIPTQTKSNVVHSDRKKYDLNIHKIDFTGNNILSNLYRDNPTRYVNSIHHQAVKTLGKDLTTLCISPDDGIIEAFHYTGSRKGLYLGIQWHPEFNHRSNELLLDADILLDYFLSCIEI
jgi:putative glutamine amidotransferase